MTGSWRGERREGQELHPGGRTIYMCIEITKYQDKTSIGERDCDLELKSLRNEGECHGGWWLTESDDRRFRAGEF